MSDCKSLKEFAKRLRMWCAMWTVMRFATGNVNRPLKPEDYGNDLVHQITAWFYDMIGYDYDRTTMNAVRRK